MSVACFYPYVIIKQGYWSRLSYVACILWRVGVLRQYKALCLIVMLLAVMGKPVWSGLVVRLGVLGQALLARHFFQRSSHCEAFASSS